MPFSRGMNPTKGFTGKKHSEETKRRMSISHAETHKKKAVCFLRCWCHSAMGGGAPAFDCCEHCCPQYKEHPAYKHYLKKKYESNKNR